MSKLKALFIGNCQSSGIETFLKHSKEFTDTFETNSYFNWQLLKDQSAIPIQSIQDADLFIYQPLRQVHGCYSTDPTVEGSIGYYVSDECIKIAYPYVFSSALWPIVQVKQNQNRWFGNSPIDKLVSNGLKSEEILDLFYKNEIDWEYKKRFDESFQILKDKESITDIKITDFIEKNLRDRLLFLIPEHPTTIIFLTLANRILEKLNMKKLDENIIKSINDLELPDSVYNSPSKMFPIHQSLINDFDLNFGEEYLYNSTDFYAQRILTYLQNF